MLDNSQISYITTDQTPKEVYPYRRVWRAVSLVLLSMFGMVVVVNIGVFAGVLRDVSSRNWGLLLILVPVAVYLWFAVRAERNAQQPREGLLTVALFSALLANGVGIPLVEGVFAPRLWLSEAGFFTRALGYTFTFGVTTEFLKYIAIRYTVFPRMFRTRIDGIAYSVAAGMGYAIVLNLRVVFEQEPTVTADAIRIAINYFSQIGFGTIMGYFMAEMALTQRRPPFFLSAGLFLGAFVQGLYIAFRAIAAGSGFAVASINGLLLAIGFAVAVILAVNFIIETNDSRAAAKAGVKRIR